MYYYILIVGKAKIIGCGTVEYIYNYLSMLLHSFEQFIGWTCS